MQKERRARAGLAVVLVKAGVQRIGVDILGPVLPELFALLLGRLVRTLEAIGAVGPVLALCLRLNVRVIGREALLGRVPPEGRIGLPESDRGGAVAAVPRRRHAAIAVDTRRLDFCLPLPRLIFDKDCDARLVPARLVAHLGLAVGVLSALDRKALDDNQGLGIRRECEPGHIIAQRRHINLLIGSRRGVIRCRRGRRRTVLRLCRRQECLCRAAVFLRRFAAVLIQRGHGALLRGLRLARLRGFCCAVLQSRRRFLRLCLCLYFVLFCLCLARHIDFIDRLFHPTALRRGIALGLLDLSGLHDFSDCRITRRIAEQNTATEQCCRCRCLQVSQFHDGLLLSQFSLSAASCLPASRGQPVN